MEERPQEDNVVGGGGRVTIREAATLLGVHPNTIKNRLRKEMYSAEKVHTERGPTWMIDRNSLQDNTPSRATQTTSVGVPAEFLQQLAREIVQEAGIKRDPGREEIREAAKAYGESLRHINTVVGATAVGVAILTQTFGLPIAAVVTTLALLAASFTLSTGGLLLVTSFMTDMDLVANEGETLKDWSANEGEPGEVRRNILNRPIPVLTRLRWMHIIAYLLLYSAVGALVTITVLSSITVVS